jgi:hypothetical protein
VLPHSFLQCAGGARYTRPSHRRSILEAPQQRPQGAAGAGAAASGVTHTAAAVQLLERCVHCNLLCILVHSGIGVPLNSARC